MEEAATPQPAATASAAAPAGTRLPEISRQISFSPAFKDFVAGAVGGLAGVVAGQPLDTVRVRLQQRGAGPSGFLACWRATASEGGWRSLFRGMGYPLSTVSFQNAAAFWGFGAACRALGDRPEDGEAGALPYGHLFVAGLAGGAASTVLQAPVDVLKIRLQLQHANPGDAGYVGPLRLLAQVLQQGGIRGLHRGMVITLIRDVPSYGAYFCINEAMRAYLDPCRRAPLSVDQEWKHECSVRGKDTAAGPAYSGGSSRSSPHDGSAPGPSAGGKGTRGAGGAAKHGLHQQQQQQVQQQQQDKPFDVFLAGGTAGVLAWLMVYPADVIKSRIQATCAQESRYKGIVDCAVRSYREEGWRVFTRGMGSTLSRAFFVNAAIFTVYEPVMKALP